MYKIKLSLTAIEHLKKIETSREMRQVKRQINRLAYVPHNDGVQLRGPLSAFYSTRAAGQRYRVVYIVDDYNRRVNVVAAGIRKEGDEKDIYVRMAKR